MSPPAIRIVSMLILACWMSPSVGALGMGLHLALEHHHDVSEQHDHDGGPHGDEHAMAISDLVQAAAHGHHHDADAASDHDHQATAGASVFTLRPSASLVAVLPAPISPDVVLVDSSRLVGSPRRGPPVPLFTAHCSLLL